jgi:hypothetical protein
MGATGDTGSGFKWKGIYDITKEYNYNDVVFDNGASYIIVPVPLPVVTYITVGYPEIAYYPTSGLATQVVVIAGPSNNQRYFPPSSLFGETVILTGPGVPEGTFITNIEGLLRDGSRYSNNGSIYQAYYLNTSQPIQPQGNGIAYTLNLNVKALELMVDHGDTGATGIRGDTGDAGAIGATGASGVGFVWKGVYDITAGYNYNDVVFYNGASYIIIPVPSPVVNYQTVGYPDIPYYPVSELPTQVVVIAGPSNTGKYFPPSSLLGQTVVLTGPGVPKGTFITNMDSIIIDGSRYSNNSSAYQAYYLNTSQPIQPQGYGVTYTLNVYVKGLELMIDAGPTGATGRGVPSGGATGQVLAKIDGSDYNTKWVDPPISGSGGQNYANDAWMYANMLSPPPFINFTTVNSTSSEIMIGWDYPTQFPLALTNSWVPTINTLNLQFNAILSNGSSLMVSTLTNVSSPYINYHNNTSYITGVVLSKLPGVNGIKTLTFPDSSVRNAYVHYNTALATLSTSTSNSLTGWYANISPSTNMSTVNFNIFAPPDPPLPFDPITSATLTDAAGAIAGFRVSSAIAGLVNVPPFNASGTPYANTPYDNTLDVTNTEELPLLNGYYYTSSSLSSVRGYRYATFAWRLGTSYPNPYKMLTFRLYNTSGVTITNNLMYAGTSLIQIYYRIEDAVSSNPTDGNSYSSGWINGNSLASPTTQSGNYFLPSTYTVMPYSGLLIGPTNLSGYTNIPVFIPNIVIQSEIVNIYFRIGLPMNVNFSFSHVAASTSTLPDPISSSTLSDAAGAVAGFRVTSATAGAANVPPFNASGTPYASIPYDINNTEELQVSNDYYYISSSSNSGMGYRYATFAWRLDTSYPKRYKTLSFRLYNTSGVTITNNLAYAGTSLIQIYYRIEDAVSSNPTDGSSYSSAWINGNSLTPPTIQSGNYFLPATYTDNTYSGLLLAATNVSDYTNIPVFIPNLIVQSEQVNIYCRVGLPMNVNFSFSHVSAVITY